MGADTFLAVSPGRTVLWTCEPEVIDQVLARREDFEKPLEAFQLLNIYGPTIAGTGGEQWRRLRKLVSPSFNERTHQEVWRVSLDFADAMVGSWLSETPEGFADEIYKDTAKLALHVLTSVCFGKELPWSKERDGYGPIPAGHSMAYGESFAALLANLRTLYFAPPVLLNMSLLPALKRARAAYDEWLQYMNEMCEAKEREMKAKNMQDSPGVLGPTHDPVTTLSHSEALGNIFVMILAGHETSGNTMSFAMLLLACRPEVQKCLQSNLDDVFGDTPANDWSYEKHLPLLLNGYTGAVIKETLRIFSPIPFLLRTSSEIPQPITLHGQTYTLPERSTVFMNVTAAHRNPRYWDESQTHQVSQQRKTSVGEKSPYPVSSFCPERWLQADFHPVPGMFLPFSDGQRSCLGRRFSMIEMCAVVARVFRHYSVELDVGGHGGVDGYDPSTKRQKWEETKAQAEKKLSEGVKFIVTMKMTDKVGLRFVKRGQEKYFDL